MFIYSFNKRCFSSSSVIKLCLLNRAAKMLKSKEYFLHHRQLLCCRLHLQKDFRFINVHFKIRDLRIFDSEQSSLGNLRFLSLESLARSRSDSRSWRKPSSERGPKLLQPSTRRITQNHHPATHIRNLAYFLFFRRPVIIRKNWFVDLHIFVRMKTYCTVSMPRRYFRNSVQISHLHVCFVPANRVTFADFP